MRMLDVQMIRQDGTGVETATGATINLDYLRTFYPRRNSETGQGTRLTFADGKGFAVADTYEAIKSAAEQAGLRLLEVSMARDVETPTTYLDPGPDNSDEDGEPLAPEARQEAAPAAINLSYLRAFYPRVGGQDGTRLTFADGGGFAVVNPYATIREGAQSLTAH